MTSALRVHSYSISAVDSPRRTDDIVVHIARCEMDDLVLEGLAIEERVRRIAEAPADGVSAMRMRASVLERYSHAGLDLATGRSDTFGREQVLPVSTRV